MDSMSWRYKIHSVWFIELIYFYSKLVKTGSFVIILFQTTTHQIAILVLFNENDEITVDEIARQTQIEQENDYIYKVISTLLKVKLLICKDRKLADDELVNDNDTLICNNKYKRYLMRIDNELFL